MSKQVLEQVILKASSDARFREQLTDNFEAAVRAYDLTPDEKVELRNGMAGTTSDREVRQTMAASASNTLAATESTSTLTSSEAASATAATVEGSSATN